MQQGYDEGRILIESRPLAAKPNQLWCFWRATSRTRASVLGDAYILLTTSTSPSSLNGCGGGKMDFFPGLAVNAWQVVSRRSTRTGSGRTRKTLGPPAIDNDMVGYTIDGVCGTGETGLPNPAVMMILSENSLAKLAPP